MELNTARATTMNHSEDFPRCLIHLGVLFDTKSPVEVYFLAVNRAIC
jgi:hypothetical protein